jgi:hypothetical protein
LKKAAGPDKTLRELALKYFFDKYSVQYQAYQPGKFADLAFVPALRVDGTEFLATPTQVCNSTEFCGLFSIILSL